MEFTGVSHANGFTSSLHESWFRSISLFDRYHGKVYGLAMSILKNKSDAEEASQDVFLTVVRKADRFRGNSALYSWFYRICVNACLMRLRKGRRTETVPIEEFLPIFTKEGAHARPVEDWKREAKLRLPEKELGRMIGGFTGELPEKYLVGSLSATSRDSPTKRRRRSWT
jgi:RNA polymerase sigma factor (sigma-70 family)